MQRTLWMACAASLSILTLVGHAQDLVAPGSAAGQALAEPIAMDGEPFGVLSADVPLPPGFAGGEPRVLVEDSEGRVFYPVVTVQTVEVVEQRPLPPSVIGRPGGLIDRVRTAVRGEPTKRQVPVAFNISALYRGSGPIRLKLVGDVTREVLIQPRRGPRGAHRELVLVWWDRYVASARDAIAGDDAPELLHKYLTSMLSERMDLPNVDLDPPVTKKGEPARDELAQPLETLALLAAIEPLREQILEAVVSSPSSGAEADVPVPPEPVWEPTLLPPADEQVAIESLASRVPPECFYLRFGSFANYVWFQEVSQRYGGDIGQAVLLRGFDYEASARMERMLATKLTAVSKMFGDQLIGDMAIIGSDLYLKEGASLGVLFYATNPQLLNSSMESDRRAVLEKNKDATQQVVNIADRPVSLLSTPDNRIRSFYVADGNFLFITTSRTLAQRFLEVGAGGLALADTPAFRWARTWMPEANDYSVFGYLSPDFFHQLVSPRVQIELRRRLEAIAHLEVAAVASQAARAEDVPASGTGDLQTAGLLPPWFDMRSDGSRVLSVDDRWIDSTRGARGSFLPILDVEVERVTPEEAEDYARTAAFYQQQWGRMDPMLIGLRRFKVEGADSEQVAFEGYIAPFEAEKYGWIARQLAEPSPIEMQLPVDDAVSVQLHMRGQSGLLAASDKYHLFGGVKDMTPPEPEETKGLIRTLQALRATPAYLGAWPRPGLIEQLPLGLGRVPPDSAGFSRMIGGLWRWQSPELSLLSFDRRILEQAIPQIAPQESVDLAQARVQVADLRGSRLAAWINGKWYERGWRGSRGNAQFLDDVQQQLRVPGAEAREVAERLLDVRLQCPLGGEYIFEPYPGARGGRWESTAWDAATFNAKGKPLPPPTYSAPWIDWFQGGKVHVTQRPDSLAVVGSFRLELLPLRVDNRAVEPQELPQMNFDLFKLPFKLFGDSAPAPKELKRQSF